MREKFQANQKYLVIAARYEFYRGISVVKGYRNFCKALGDDAMCFNDFDFWWFRFSNGNFDLDTQPPKTADFNSFPHHIIDKIIGEMDYAARCLFRKTSKKYRKAVDAIPFVIEKIKFESLSTSTWLRINQLTIEFNRRKENKDPNRIQFCSEDYLKLAADELVFIFKLKNVRVEKLSFFIHDKVFKEDLDILKSLKFKFPVETFKIRFGCSSREGNLIDVQDEVMKILPYLKPGILENLEFHIHKRGLKLKTDRISRTDQWFGAKRLRIKGNVIVNAWSLNSFQKLSLNGTLF
uniref:F-box domain-containing protein n=1 Tax=Caenorhabditis tropicalis TaxID=1561998 RepID=A0A1I7UPB3_9PELO